MILGLPLIGTRSSRRSRCRQDASQLLRQHRPCPSRCSRDRSGPCRPDCGAPPDRVALWPDAEGRRRGSVNRPSPGRHAKPSPLADLAPATRCGCAYSDPFGGTDPTAEASPRQPQSARAKRARARTRYCSALPKIAVDIVFGMAHPSDRDASRI